MDGSKMSKSLGNLVFIDKLRTQYDARAIRIGILDHPYRHDWHWETDLMPNSAERLDRWNKGAGGEGGRVLDAVRKALDNDLDCPAALAAIDAGAAAGHDIIAAASLMGVELG